MSFIVIDNTHLTENGLKFLAQKTTKLFIATANPDHPALEMQKAYSNIIPISFEHTINFPILFQKLKEDYQIDKITVQTGGTLNTLFVREGLIDRLLVVVAPVLIGGKDTSTIMDNESLHAPREITKLKPLKLVKAEPLKDSYLLLEYQVLNNE